jgi:DNA-directed RNA polymerase subunit omega
VARITIEDCLKRVKNRFLLVNLAAKRVRQIREGSEYLVSSPKNEDIVVSLREIAAGKVTMKDDQEEIEKEKEEIEDNL